MLYFCSHSITNSITLLFFSFFKTMVKQKQVCLWSSKVQEYCWSGVLGIFLAENDPLKDSVAGPLQGLVCDGRPRLFTLLVLLSGDSLQAGPPCDTSRAYKRLSHSPETACCPVQLLLLPFLSCGPSLDSCAAWSLCNPPHCLRKVGCVRWPGLGLREGSGVHTSVS